MRIQFISIIVIVNFAIGNLLNAQTTETFAPFNGFQFGYIGQFKLVDKCNFINLSDDENLPIPLNTVGGDIGFEFSYHFNKYYGISLGLRYGTNAEHKFKIFDSQSILTNENNYISSPYCFLLGISTPLLFEIHLPISKKLYFFSNIGTNLTPIINLILGYNNYFITRPFYLSNNDTVPFFKYNLQNDQFFSFEIISNFGIYYKLPKNDLIKISLGYNFNSNNFLEGYLMYNYSNSLSALEIKNNFINIQIGYIHTFNYSNARKYILYRSKTKLSRSEIKKQALLILN
jgi:hypothetical protein